MFDFLFKKNYPVPGKDATWIAHCEYCDDMELFVSRGGLKIGGTEHCYGCGHEKKTCGMKQTNIDDMIVSNWCQWQKFPLLPYNYHTLSENDRWKALGMEPPKNVN